MFSGGLDDAIGGWCYGGGRAAGAKPASCLVRGAAAA